MTEYTVPAPAKINCYLHIVGKRADGYHQLDTVFQLIDLQDTVRLKTRQDGHLRLHTPIEGLPDEQHLAMRAALLLQSQCANQSKTQLGADIWVDKRIPSGAGLGGGSSDAASTLLGLNQLWGCGLSRLQLQELGLRLGADVPFFCSGFGAARGQGIGEDLTEVDVKLQSLIVVFPACHVPTPAVFRHPDLTWRAKQAIISALEENAHDFFDGVDFRNDLEVVATAIAPPIGQAIAVLKAAGGAKMVRMSGSGSAVFAEYANVKAQESAWVSLQSQLPSNWQAWKVKGLKKHPFVV